MNYRVIKKDNKFYPQYYTKYWINLFSGWNNFQELCFGSFNPPEPDTYEDVFFLSKEEAVNFINNENKPSIEIFYENSK